MSIYFENKFKNDTVVIYVNREICDKTRLKTHNIEKIAYQTTLDGLNIGDTISFSFNGGKINILEYDSKMATFSNLFVYKRPFIRFKKSKKYYNKRF